MPRADGARLFAMMRIMLADLARLAQLNFAIRWNLVRTHEVLAAIQGSGGAAVSVSEEEIVEAMSDVAKSGLYVEPTSASGAAALSGLLRRGVIRYSRTWKRRRFSCHSPKSSSHRAENGPTLPWTKRRTRPSPSTRSSNRKGAKRFNSQRRAVSEMNGHIAAAGLAPNLGSVCL